MRRIFGRRGIARLSPRQLSDIVESGASVVPSDPVSPRVTEVTYRFGEWQIRITRPSTRDAHTPGSGDVPETTRGALARWVSGDTAWVVQAGEQIVYDLTVCLGEHGTTWVIAVRSAERRIDGSPRAGLPGERPHVPPPASDLPADVVLVLREWLARSELAPA